MSRMSAIEWVVLVCIVLVVAATVARGCAPSHYKRVEYVPSAFGNGGTWILEDTETGERFSQSDDGVMVPLK